MATTSADAPAGDGRPLGVKRVVLFGSATRDELDTTSDADVLVEFEGPTTFAACMDVKFYLEDLLGRPVDLVQSAMCCSSTCTNRTWVTARVRTRKQRRGIGTASRLFTRGARTRRPFTGRDPQTHRRMGRWRWEYWSRLLNPHAPALVGREWVGASDSRDEKIDRAKDINRTVGKRNYPLPEQLARYPGHERSIHNEIPVADAESRV